MECTFNATNDNTTKISGREKMTLDLATPTSKEDALKKGNSGPKTGPKVNIDDEGPEASLPIASIGTPISDEDHLEVSPVQTRGRSNSITAEDLARDVVAVTTGSTDGPKKVKRKKKKASQRMRPKSHSPLRTAAQTEGKPLMDLRQILKKHEKKSETKEMYDGNDSQSSEFYGSLSSIPFLHPEKEEKKQRKGKRTKKKGASTSKSPKKEATKITVTKEYTDADVQLWKSMSALDGSYMEEAAHRPDHMFPVTDPSLPEKEKKKVAPPSSPTKHTERGFHRPDDWVECDHPTKRNQKKKTYQTKNEADRNHNTNEAKEIVEPTVDGKAANVAKEESKQSIVVADVAVPSTTAASKASTKQKKHKKTSLAITFQDGCVISGDFRPKEKVDRVIQDLKQDLLRTDASLPDFDLWKKNSGSDEKELLDPTMTLNETGLVPSGEVFVHWKDAMDETKEPGWYLDSGEE